MTAQQRKTIGWTVALLVSLTVLLGFSFTLGAGYTKNKAEHEAINTEVEETNKKLAAEVEKSAANSEDISDIKINVSAMQSTLKAQHSTLEKIENKLP